jgi:hypothetical protein
MTAVPYKVYVVVDREFGEQLADLEQGAPVWIVDTPTNKPVAQRLWKERPDKDHLTGITTFKAPDSLSPEDMLGVPRQVERIHRKAARAFGLVPTS